MLVSLNSRWFTLRVRVRSYWDCSSLLQSRYRRFTIGLTLFGRHLVLWCKYPISIWNLWLISQYFLSGWDCHNSFFKRLRVFSVSYKCYLFKIVIMYCFLSACVNVGQIFLKEQVWLSRSTFNCQPRKIFRYPAQQLPFQKHGK